MEENGAINTAIESTYDVDDAKYAGQQELPPTPQNVAREDIREFFRMNPPESFGGLNLIMVHDWLAGMESVFQVVPCSKEQNVTLAS